MVRRLLALALVAALGGAGAVAAGQITLARRDADTLQQKLALINRHAVVPVPRATVRSTNISEREVNAYLRYHAREEIPVGVVDPYVRILGDGRVSGRAIVDLDAVRKHKTRGWTDPAGYLTGRVPVEATGILKTKEGVGRFHLESAAVSGMTVPNFLLQEIVSYYTRTPEQPEGVTLEAPFELPAAIREVRLAKGQALIVQ